MSKHEILRIEGIPVYQNKMFGSELAGRACPRGNVVLSQDWASGLVSNHAFNADKLSYDSSYQNEQGHSTAFQSHVMQVLDVVDRHFRDMRILEIGCGKGAFLELMRGAGYDAHGIDPAYEGTSEHIFRDHFAPGTNVRGDAIVMRHVLEHIADPFRFLEDVRSTNDDRGLIYIEVPCLEWILRRCAWFDVLYEHVNYFRLADFTRMFGHIVEAGHLFGDQYIYVVAELSSLRNPTKPSLGNVSLVHRPANLFSGLDRCAQAMRPGARSAVWGAAAKGVMFVHHLQSRGVSPTLAIDINPAKQGRYLAGSGLPVLSPNDAFAQLGNKPDIFVMNSNYLSEIQSMGGSGPNYIVVDQI